MYVAKEAGRKRQVPLRNTLQALLRCDLSLSVESCFLPLRLSTCTCIAVMGAATRLPVASSAILNLTAPREEFRRGSAPKPTTAVSQAPEDQRDRVWCPRVGIEASRHPEWNGRFSKPHRHSRGRISLSLWMPGVHAPHGSNGILFPTRVLKVEGWFGFKYPRREEKFEETAET
jgi:hypothetical protein